VVDACDVLVDDAPRADVHVADLAVAHLSRRQTDVALGGIDAGVRPGAEQAVEVGGAGQRHGVVVARLATAEAVEDDQQGRGDAAARDGGPFRYHRLESVLAR